MNMGLFYFLALLAGAATTIQTGINAQLRIAWAKSSILAAFVSFSVGALCLLFYLLATRAPLPPLPAKIIPWHWIGGLFGAFFISATIYVAPRLGATTMIGLVLAGQLGVSLILDHFGLIGYAQKSITWQRILGAALVGGGAFLIRRF